MGSPIGERVVLRCMVEAYPSAITYWVRHGPNGREEMLLNRPQYNIEEQKFAYKTVVSLTIDNFAVEDIGLYKCVSTNSLGMKESNVRVYGEFYYNCYFGTCFFLHRWNCLQIIFAERKQKTSPPNVVTEINTTPEFSGE